LFLILFKSRQRRLLEENIGNWLYSMDNKYLIKKLIGSGSYGNVYKVIDQNNEL
jgi:hypothetical protein